MEQDFIVANKLGIHAHAAAQIVELAKRFESEIWIIKDGVKVSGRSILGILTLMCPKGTKVRIAAKGRDAADALNAFAVLFRSKFGEV